MMKAARQKNKYTLVSDNPAYQPYTVAAEDIVEVWQAQMIISKANVQQRWDVGQLASLVNNLQQQVSVLKKKVN
jgi:polyhydroxyalkanoate synthesis regulator phasin